VPFSSDLGQHSNIMVDANLEKLSMHASQSKGNCKMSSNEMQSLCNNDKKQTSEKHANDIKHSCTCLLRSAHIDLGMR